MNERKNKMGTMSEGKLLFSMALPIMISMLIQALYNVVDSIYVAQISEDALTAVSLSAPIQGFMISLGVGTGVGVNSVLSRRLGQRRYEDAEKVCANALQLSILSWVPFLLIGLFAAEPFLRLFSQETTIVTMGVQYISVCCIWSFGVFVQIILSRIMQAFGDGLFQMTTQGVGAVANIILDPIFIFGVDWLGIPAMGVTGAAIATVAGQILSMFIGIILVKVKQKPIRVSIRAHKLHGKTVKDIYQVGLPSIIMQSITSVTTIGLNTILMPMSTTAVAVYGVYFKLQNFVFMPVFGINNALVPIVGFNYGARNKARIMRAFKLALISAVTIMAAGTLVFVLFPGQLLQMFNAEETMMSIGVPALRIISLCFPCAGLAIAIGGVFQAVGNGVYSMLVSIIRQLVVILPVAFLFSLTGNVNLVWFAFLISEIFGVSMSLFFFYRTYNKKLKDLTQKEFDRPVPEMDQLPEAIEM